MIEWRVPRYTWVYGGAVFLAFALMAYNVADWSLRGVGDPWAPFDAAFALGLYVIAFVLLVVRPRVRVGETDVEVRNPLGTVCFRRADVAGTELTPFGLRFELTDGRRPVAAVFVDAFAWGNADWRECVAAETGEDRAD